MSAISIPERKGLPVVVFALYAPTENNTIDERTTLVQIAVLTEKKKKGRIGTTEPSNAEKPTTQALFVGVILGAASLSS